MLGKGERKRMDCISEAQKRREQGMIAAICRKSLVWPPHSSKRSGGVWGGTGVDDSVPWTNEQ